MTGSDAVQRELLDVDVESARRTHEAHRGYGLSYLSSFAHANVSTRSSVIGFKKNKNKIRKKLSSPSLQAPREERRGERYSDRSFLRGKLKIKIKRGSVLLYVPSALNRSMSVVCKDGSGGGISRSLDE